MQQILLALTFFITTFWSISFTNASSIPNDNNPSQIILITAPDDLLLGWRGIYRKEDADKFQKKPYASDKGELGAVVYLADGTDLATYFATKKGYLCEVYANGKRWREIQKYWVSQKELVDYKNRMQELHPGAVLFASHDTSPAISDPKPWQMGIRPSSIDFLALSAQCKPVDEKAPHKKMDYSLRIDWNIHGNPERPPNITTY